MRMSGRLRELQEKGLPTILPDFNELNSHFPTFPLVEEGKWFFFHKKGSDFLSPAKGDGDDVVFPDAIRFEAYDSMQKNYFFLNAGLVQQIR